MIPWNLILEKASKQTWAWEAWECENNVYFWTYIYDCRTGSKKLREKWDIYILANGSFERNQCLHSFMFVIDIEDKHL